MQVACSNALYKAYTNTILASKITIKLGVITPPNLGLCTAT